MGVRIFIFHGTEGHPQENWFPWLKEQLENVGHEVIVPQFPSPPIVAAKLSEWFDVLKAYEQQIDKDTILIGHSLGGIFTLRVLEKLAQPVKAAVFVGTPVGVKPILYYDRDNSFSGFDFDWKVIKARTSHFAVYHSDDDPYVAPANGEKLAEKLGVELSLVPHAGHFNGSYTKFELLRDKILQIIKD